MRPFNQRTESERGMKTWSCMLIAVQLMACTSGSSHDTGAKPEVTPEILSGEADFPVGASATGFAWFSEYRSIQCPERTGYHSSIGIFVSDVDGCGEVTRAPCAAFKNVSLLFLGITNEGPSNMPIKPREYALGKKIAVTGHNEYALQVNALFADNNGKKTDDPGFDADGNLTWSGSVTLDDLSEQAVSGSLDLTAPMGVSYQGTFTALKCDFLQTFQSPLCFGETVEGAPTCD